MADAYEKEDHEFGGMVKLLTDASKKSQISQKNIRAHLFTFAFAGHETTSTALRWCLYYLGHYPEWQTKIAREFEEVMNGEVTSTSLKKAINTQAFINEVLRISHVIDIIDTRKLTKDVTLPDGYVRGIKHKQF